LLSASVAADPHVALVVDGDAMVRLGPVVALSLAAPVADQVALAVELEHRRRRGAAHRGLRRGGRVLLAGLERAGAMADPDVIARVHRHADRLSEDPVVGQRLRPQRIDFEPRRRWRVSDDGFRALLEKLTAGGEDGEEREKNEPGDRAARHMALRRAL